MVAEVGALPRWDLDVVFPGVESPEFDAEYAAAVSALRTLAARFDELSIGSDEAPTEPAVFEEVASAYNQVVERAEVLFSYLYGLVTADTRDDRAQAKRSALEKDTLILAQLWPRFVHWIGRFDIDALIRTSTVARDHEFILRYCQIEAAHLMSQPEEALAAELHLTGGGAWEKLHDKLTAQIMVDVALPDGPRRLPMSEVRNLAHNADRDVRRRAYEAEVSAWRAHAVPIAAALNSIKGEAIALLDRRQWHSPVERAAFQNHVDMATLDAMMDASREAFPVFRRYLRAKARHFGDEHLAWFDIFAPVGASGRAWEYGEAEQFIADHFGGFSERLRGLAVRAFGERWVDAGPRAGKVGGAYCMALRRDESRILANYVPSHSGMSTLAHELGHAYHNLCLAERTPLQKETPSTLAETASTFCETIIRHAATQGADREEELMIIEGSLQDATQVVVDITSRFLFERALFVRRRKQELSIDELCGLMLDAQRQTYGDGLAEETLHPYMWAVKSHYYSASDGFYNFPYMFGLLFGLGLYARYQADPASFLRGYDELLSMTGMADAATLADRFGIDVRSGDFWRQSLGQIEADVRRFEELLA